jgi:hypothetical protein
VAGRAVVSVKGCQLCKSCYISSESGQGGEYNAPRFGEKGLAVLEIWHEWWDDVAGMPVSRKGYWLNMACYISSESGQRGDYSAPSLREKGPVILEIWHEWEMMWQGGLWCR